MIGLSFPRWRKVPKCFIQGFAEPVVLFCEFGLKRLGKEGLERLTTTRGGRLGLPEKLIRKFQSRLHEAHIPIFMGKFKSQLSFLSLAAAESRRRVLRGSGDL